MSKNKRKNKLLTLFLTAFFLSASAGTLAACAGNEDASEVDQSEISSSQTADNSRIKNGGFESDTAKDSAPIITSPKSWSKSSQVSSKTASGVIDTKSEAWDSLTKTGNVSPANETEAAEKWAEMNAYDRLQYIKNWKDANSGKDVDDLEFYTDKYNISADDIPEADVNPGTHYAGGEAGADKNTRVLMIHNAVSSTSAIGAAQYYTSSSTITLAAGTAAKFSVWVKTAKLTYGSENSEADKNRGAYIAVSQTVGGKSKEQVQVKNINTEKINPAGENNGWVKYEFYVKGSNYAASTFTVALGLGQGTSSNQFGGVNGYAFFDDLECSVIRSSEYDALVPASATDIKQVTDTEYEFSADRDCIDIFKYAINLSSSLSAGTFADLGITSSDARKIDAKNNVFDDADAIDKYGIFTKSAIDAGIDTESNEYFKAVWQSDFASFPFADASDLLVLFSASKTAYEAQSDTITLSANTCALYSVWVKTSKIASGNTGAGITLTEKASISDPSDDDATALLSSLDSTTGTKTDVDGSAGAKEEDIFLGWQQCTLLIENKTDSDKYFSLTFTFGATADDAEKSAYGAGYAMFTGIESATLTSRQAEFYSTGTYAAKKTFEAETEDTGAAAFDDRAGDEDTDRIKTGFTNLSSYYGVEGGSSWVNKNNHDETKVNAYEYAGLVNKAYASAYAGTYAGESDLTALFAYPEALFENAEEPLMIYNKEAGKSYGFIAKSSTSVSSDSYKTISVRVKTGNGAKASIYLVNADAADKTAFTFNTPKVAYWYDKTGNVCAKDPTDSSFKRDTDTAFFLDKRGLYVANTAWTGYDESLMKDKVFANLSAYEKDADNNLVVAEGGVSYNYDSTQWNNQGVDGIAYYYKDGKYYAYSDHTTEVTDLMTLVSAGKLTPKSLTADTQGEIALSAENIDTNGQWQTFTFHLHTGNEAKNYRLEVWSGVRNGETENAAGSYVMFAADKRSDLTSDTWKSNLDESVKKAKGSMSEDEFKKSENVRYYAFSFLDSAKFLRYDSTLDKDEVGNSYTSYDSTSSDYAEGVSYLKYADVDGNTLVYVDYSKTEVTVTADTADDSSNDTEEDSADSNGINVWLLASSIILAAVLLLTIVSIAVRRILKKKGRKAKAPKQKKAKKQ